MQQNKGKNKDEYKALTIDVDKYQQLLDDVDIPDDQKQEFLENIIYIVVQFVDWGWGVNPTQHLSYDEILSEKSDINDAIPSLVRKFADQNKTTAEIETTEQPNVIRRETA